MTWAVINCLHIGAAMQRSLSWVYLLGQSLLVTFPRRIDPPHLTPSSRLLSHRAQNYPIDWWCWIYHSCYIFAKSQLMYPEDFREGRWTVFYVWLSNVLANDRVHYICNAFYRWLTPSPSVDRKRARAATYRYTAHKKGTCYMYNFRQSQN